MAFTWEYPVFILAHEAKVDTAKSYLNISYHEVAFLTEPGAPTGLAVFTDRPAAEQFRDEHRPLHEVFELPTEGALAVVLRQVRGLAEVVAFDPYRLGYQTVTMTIDSLIGPT